MSRPVRRSPPDAPRAAALEVLRAVRERDAYANLTITAVLREHRLHGRDAAFATELAYGALRGQGRLDAVLAACVDRPLADVDPLVLDLLRLGAHQLLSMRVPTHAAVSSTVDLARSVTTTGPIAFVNAVLRRVAAQDMASWLAVVAPPREQDLVGHLSVVHSHPAWVVRALRDSLAGEGAVEELEALLEADNAPALVGLAALPGLATVDELVSAGASAGLLARTAATWPGGAPGALGAVREGRVRVQDEGSQLVALALADAPLEGLDARWLDLCAGPGGKAALLAADGASRGASVTALEIAEHRADLVRRALAPVPGSHRVVVGDGRAVGSEQPGQYDRVLVDAPCTGLGALRRRPEARWRRAPSDLASLAPLQRDLLASALDAVRPGGVVVYATCSPVLAETRFVVTDVLRRRTDVEQEPPRQLWPHRDGTDAMWWTVLRRH